MARVVPAAAPGVAAPKTLTWMLLAALVGFGFAAASTWVHYRLIADPLYSSVCDVNATFSCTEAYTSRFGSVAGVPVALIGVIYFGFIALLVALAQRSLTARQNVAGYVFVLSTLGLAGALYLAYASFFVLKAVCLLCLGAYAAILALFVLSGTSARQPMGTLPSRAGRDLTTLRRTPTALLVAGVFVVLAVLAMATFPTDPAAASAASSATAAAAGAPSAPVVLPTIPAETLRQFEDYLAAQPRVPVAAGGSGAAVTLVKFNDYQCPPCGQTYREYKPILAELQQRYPGKIVSITKDYPLDPECNTMGSSHTAACEAAVAVRLARERNRATEMEDWLFANQSSLTPDFVKRGVAQVAGVTDFDARYPQLLPLVRADIAQGVQLEVKGTPTFFLNGLRLPNLLSHFFKAALEWELRRVSAS